MIRAALFVLAAGLLVGCKTIPPTSGCDWAKPIYVSCDDVLTDPTAKQIKTHDETGALKCGWKPHKGAKCPKPPSH